MQIKGFEFLHNAKKIEKMTWMKNKKMQILIGVGVIIVATAIFKTFF